MPYLQETVDNLAPDVIRVRGEDTRREESVRTARDFVLGAEEFIYMQRKESIQQHIHDNAHQALTELRQEGSHLCTAS